jgi:hypothetical protein
VMCCIVSYVVCWVVAAPCPAMLCVSAAAQQRCSGWRQPWYHSLGSSCAVCCCIFSHFYAKYSTALTLSLPRLLLPLLFLLTCAVAAGVPFPRYPRHCALH